MAGSNCEPHCRVWREVLQGRGTTAAFAALWFAATFAVYFVYAGRIESFGWNSIEFIIANHLEDFGRYALGANYPAAIWRPVGPTFMVLAINVFARDPLLTYQLLAGLALATFVTSTYLLNRRLFGHLLAHAGAALAFVTPLVSVVFDQSCAFDLALVLFAGGKPNLARVRRLHPVCARQQADCAMDVGGFGWLGVLLSVPSGKHADGGVLLSSRSRFMAIRRRQIVPLILPLAIFVAIFAAFQRLGQRERCARRYLVAQDDLSVLRQPGMDGGFRTRRSRRTRKPRP